MCVYPELFVFGLGPPPSFSCGWKGGKATTRGMIWVEFYYMCCCVCMCLLSLSRFTPHSSLKTGGYIVGQFYVHALSCEHEVNAEMPSTAIPRGWRESC